MLRTLLVASFLVGACAACGGNDGGADPSDPPLPTTSAPSTSTSSSSTIPSYLEPFSPDERAAYEDAVAAYARYVAQDNRFLAAGETTVAASDFYHHDSIDWASSWANLAQLANNDVTVTGATAVKSTRPVTIKLGATDVIVLRQCLDQSQVVVTQNGKRLDQPQFKTPHSFRVRLERQHGETWWRSGIAKQEATC
jgi:hypothetical protein